MFCRGHLGLREPETSWGYGSPRPAGATGARDHLGLWETTFGAQDTSLGSWGNGHGKLGKLLFERTPLQQYESITGKNPKA